ncbi:MAG TPA: phosphoribosyltransferase [Sedimenticola sp.]|nr:phosphoribosyltransferase [Sedimenticola sp.]
MEHNRQSGDAESDKRCERVTWEQFQRLAWVLAAQIRDAGFRPDLIVAIARGGYLPARQLSDCLDIFDLASVRVEHYHGVHKTRQARVRYPLTAKIDGRRILLVDDVSDSGDTFEVTLAHLHSLGRPAEIRCAVLHHKQTSGFVPDYFAEEQRAWRWIVYPWAITEDLASLLREILPAPVEACERRLRERHGLLLPRETLEAALRCIDPGQVDAGEGKDPGGR